MTQTLGSIGWLKAFPKLSGSQHSSGPIPQGKRGLGTLSALRRATFEQMKDFMSEKVGLKPYHAISSSKIDHVYGKITS